MHLSGYRIIWMLVMFDLPVTEKPERKAAARFRHFLLDEGFEMSQFSVYVRYCKGKEQVDAIAGRIERALPEAGKVKILSFTDKQYESIKSFYGKAPDSSEKAPDQLTLF